MERDWPLVGRAADLERVLALLRGGAGGVVLAGPAGVGKTRLAVECLALAAERGFVPVRVAATQAASTLPFGAFAPLLPDLAAGVDRTEVLRQVGRAIVGRGEGTPVALLVDDAHLLDESSAALVHQLAGRQDTFVLATVRTGEPASDAVIALWKDDRAERIEVGPLSRAGVDSLLTAVLGAPVDGASVHRLYERSEGNLLFLKELVLAALDTGGLRGEGGLWRLHDKLTASDRLVELIEARLGGLAEADRGVLEVAALGEPLGVDLVEGLGDDAGLDRLARRHLVRIEESGRRLEVRLAHPLYGDVIRARLPPLRARALNRMLADGVEATGARRREDALRVATWRLDGGGQRRPELLLAAAEQARLRWSLPLAERLARAAREAGGTFEAGFLLGQVLSELGRREDAVATLTPLLPEAGNDSQRSSLAVALIESLFAIGRSREGVAIAEETEAAIADDRARHEVTACRAVFLMASDRVAEARALLEDLLPVAEGRAMSRAAGTGGLLLARAGRFAEALAILERGLAANDSLDGEAAPWGNQENLGIRGHTLVLAGRLGEGLAVATEGYDQAVAAGWTYPQAEFAQLLMFVFLLQGRVERAARWGRIAAGLFREMRSPFLLGWNLASMALALALAGQVDEAGDALAEAEALSTPGGLQIDGVDRLRARAWVAVAQGDLPAAHVLLREASVHARSRGEYALECFAVHDLARLGKAAEVASRLAELATVVEGPFASILAAHAEALRGQDPAGLEAASAAFETMGADLLAAEAAADAAVAWRRAGEARKAAGAERRAASLAARCEGAKTPGLTAVATRAALSARELEIARLAAAGSPNKDIAARLYLSVRTVENKLHAAYEKLGIEGRAELTEALESY